MRQQGIFKWTLNSETGGGLMLHAYLFDENIKASYQCGIQGADEPSRK